MTPAESNPYRAAGTFTRSSYTERQADRDLRASLAQNQRYQIGRASCRGRV